MISGKVYNFIETPWIGQYCLIFAFFTEYVIHIYAAMVNCNNKLEESNCMLIESWKNDNLFENGY